MANVIVTTKIYEPSSGSSEILVKIRKDDKVLIIAPTYENAYFNFIQDQDIEEKNVTLICQNSDEKSAFDTLMEFLLI